MNLEFKITPHLEKLAKKSKAIRKQFYPSKEELKNQGKTIDPLKEQKHNPVKGLIHRYSNRVLVLLTLNCAAYCRFCFRRRIVSDIEKGVLNNNDLEKIVSYIERSEKKGSEQSEGSYIERSEKKGSERSEGSYFERSEKKGSERSEGSYFERSEKKGSEQSEGSYFERSEKKGSGAKRTGSYIKNIRRLKK